MILMPLGPVWSHPHQSDNTNDSAPFVRYYRGSLFAMAISSQRIFYLASITESESKVEVCLSQMAYTSITSVLLVYKARRFDDS